MEQYDYGMAGEYYEDGMVSHRAPHAPRRRTVAEGGNPAVVLPLPARLFGAGAARGVGHLFFIFLLLPRRASRCFCQVKTDGGRGARERHLCVAIAARDLSGRPRNADASGTRP